MTFYFKPPRGTITLPTLNQCIQERIKFLKIIESLKYISDVEDHHLDFQYVTEGTAFDRTGHFMLRLLALKEDHVYQFFVKHEMMLFEKRLQSLEPLQLRLELKTVQRHIQEMMETSESSHKYSNFLKAFSYVCKELTLKVKANHAFSPLHSNDCEEYCLDVPFTTCLPLIQKRQVEIKNGIASIPCGKWHLYLLCLFHIHLDYGMELLRLSPIETAFADSRIEYIFQLNESSLKLCNFEKHEGLKSEDVDKEMMRFPPCMASLHKSLRQKHRLSHDARYYYSLFLKEIGMSMSEAADFWKKEYLQPHTGCTRCTHSWQKDEKRYLYGIRHLYGLEGAHKTYKMPGCKKLQSLILGPITEGGCPFQHYDNDNLVQSLYSDVRKNKDAILSLLEINKTRGPLNACRQYHQLIHKLLHKTADNENEISKLKGVIEDNPVNFYLQLLQTND